MVVLGEGGGCMVVLGGGGVHGCVGGGGVHGCTQKMLCIPTSRLLPKY